MERKLISGTGSPFDPWVEKTTEFDSNSLRPLHEYVGNEHLEYTYGQYGADRHRLVQVSRGLASGGVTIPIRQFEYDDNGQVLSVFNGDNLVGAYTYGEDGRLLTEANHAALATNGPLTKTHTRTVGLANGNWRSAARMTMRNSYVVHDNTDTFDNVGRHVSSFDHRTATTFIEKFYDEKPTGYYGSYAVEGRTVYLNQKTNQLGRLAMVKHPAGLTLYEYDALGRVIMLIQYDGDPDSTPLNPALMRTYQVTYDAVGRVTSLRYPSGRKAVYIQGDDSRGPVEVYMATSTTGTASFHRIASQINYDVDGRVSSWAWGTAVPPGRHTITRDMIGRVLSIVDKDSGGTLKYQHDYLGYDEDGSTTHDQEQDTGGSTILYFQSQILDTDRISDKLISWKGPLDGSHELILGPSGRRETEVIGGIDAYSYLHWLGEGINRRTKTNYPKSLDLNWFDSASVSSIDWGNDNSREITSFIRGPRGDYVGYTATNGTHTQQRDDQMHRWYLEGGPAGLEQYGWAPTGQLVERIAFSGLPENSYWERDEYIYLQGMPVGVTHTRSNQTSPVSWWLIPDAMGTPRRVIERYGQMRQRVGLRMDPWGLGVEVQTNTSIGNAPRLPFRLPGQFADASNLVENGWRTYLPELGVYLQPDPMHRQSAMSGSGPQAYAYANGNPLRYIDATGQSPADARKLMSWASDGIQFLTSAGLRHPNPYWNNFSSQQPGASAYEFAFIEPPPPYMNCIKQTNWMYQWLNEKERANPLDDPWIYYQMQSSLPGNLLGHSWLVIEDQDECSRRNQKLLVDTWLGVVRFCRPGERDCAMGGH